MEQRDTILALIQKLFQLLQALLSKLPVNNFENQADLDQFTDLFQENLGIELHHLTSLEKDEDLLQYIHSEGTHTLENQNTLITLLQEISKKSKSINPPFSDCLQQKTLTLSTHFALQSKTTSWWNH